MKKINKYIGALLMLTIMVTFSSCQSEDQIFDRVVGRTWVGDLGFVTNDVFREPLESGIFLGGNGFGYDDQYRYDNGPYYGQLQISWGLNGYTLYINYGNVAAPREIRNVYVGGGQITGALYINGIYAFDTTLYMQ